MQAFSSSDHLENFSGVKLAILSFGTQYGDVDRLVKAFRIQKGADQSTFQDWLESFVRMLSENSIRTFLAKVIHKLTLSTATETISVEFSRRKQQPKFLPESSHIRLPVCASFESFASRMRLGEYMSHSDAQNEKMLTQEESKGVIGLGGLKSGLVGMIDVFVVTRMLLVSVGDPCKELSAPSARASATLEGHSTACKLAISMLALMALGVQLAKLASRPALIMKLPHIEDCSMHRQCNHDAYNCNLLYSTSTR